jgi:glycerol uptake facilitator-like aquaporin
VHNDGAGAWSVGPLTGAAFNPAVAVGGALMHIFQWHEIWIHIVASCLAAIAAALTFHWTMGPDVQTQYLVFLQPSTEKKTRPRGAWF